MSDSAARAEKARRELRGLCEEIGKEQARKSRLDHLRARSRRLRAIADIFIIVRGKLHG